MNSDVILLGHGSGGRLSHQLLDELIIPALSCGGPADQNDAALLDSPSGRIAFTTDSYVVDPVFFPGGNIGDLAVNGTVNDLAMMGAIPLWMSVGLILEEGFGKKELADILASMKRAADIAGVSIVTGDTKVLPRGKADRIFINTSGIGVIKHDHAIHGANASPEDSVIISGTVGDHGIAVMAAREGLALDAELVSDSASLNGLVEEIIAEAGDSIHVLRDPTRGGVATIINEIALQSAVSITLHEQALPISQPVRDTCALLGIDPLFVANEGKLLAFVAADAVERTLARIRRHPLGVGAAVIGYVSAGDAGRVLMKTAVGEIRVVEMLAGNRLPRIC